jgi:thiamine-monophosphate kinase
MPNMPIPFGDDVSAVEIQSGKLAILKTDMLIGKTDVPPGMSLSQAARKAAVMNISDLAAKGVKPIALLASIGVPSNLSKKHIEQIGTGLNSGAREYGAYILGGDTSEASDLVISCAVFGIGEKKRIILRSGAEPDDIVAVTGFFGKTAAGLQILLQKLSVPSGTRKTLVNSVLMPHARLTEGLTLAETHTITASIDSSDGLAWSLHEISKASHVGFIIENLPIAEEAKQFAKMQKIDPTELCLYGGEEYELVVTVKHNLWKKASEKVPLIQIGHATKKKTLTLMAGEKTIPIETRGWEHFKTKHSNIVEQEVKPFSG